MLNLVFLPATEQGDSTYGSMPGRVNSFPDAAVCRVNFPSMVWYNASVRQEAIQQIRSFGKAPVTLVGFSKSGLGAWNLARSLPDLVAGTIIFDAPVAREKLPPWGTAPFYRDDAAWQRDLPMRTIRAFQAAMPAHHRLILISGASFHDEMAVLAQAMSGSAAGHIFLPRPRLQHSWNSGWIEEGLSAIVNGSVQARIRESSAAG